MGLLLHGLLLHTLLLHILRRPDPFLIARLILKPSFP